MDAIIPRWARGIRASIPPWRRMDAVEITSNRPLRMCGGAAACWWDELCTHTRTHPYHRQCNRPPPTRDRVKWANAVCVCLCVYNYRESVPARSRVMSYLCSFATINCTCSCCVSHINPYATGLGVRFCWRYPSF